MAALTDDKNYQSQGAGEMREYDAIASDIIYKGAAVGIKQSTTNTGYARPTQTDAGGVDVFAGIAMKQVDNSSGSNGDKQVECYTKGRFKLEGFTGLTAADTGKLVYASDDQTFTLTSTNNTLIGRITKYVSATVAWVEIIVPRDQ